jgi:SAM-dependent methyltransferase
MVTGTDLSAVKAEIVPRNCKLIIQDAEKEWDWEQKFDYIHSRMVMVGIRDWTRLVQQAFKALKPGGWIEMQDLNFPVQSPDNSASADSPLMRWSSLMIEGADKLGMDLKGASRIPQLLRDAGFEEVQVDTPLWPLGPWMEDEKSKKLGAMSEQNFLNGLPGFTTGFFSRGLGWTMEEIQKTVAEVTEQVNDPSSHAGINIPFIWARKPE